MRRLKNPMYFEIFLEIFFAAPEKNDKDGHISSGFDGILSEIAVFFLLFLLPRGRILGRNWDKSLKSFPPCYSVTSINGYYSPRPP